MKSEGFLLDEMSCTLDVQYKQRTTPDGHNKICKLLDNLDNTEKVGQDSDLNRVCIRANMDQIEKSRSKSAQDNGS